MNNKALFLVIILIIARFIYLLAEKDDLKKVCGEIFTTVDLTYP